MERQNRMVNPIIQKVIKADEKNDEFITYNSVLTKTGIFLAWVVVGVVNAILLHAITTPIVIEGADFLSISNAEAVFFLLAGILSVVFSIVASFSKNLAGVFGTISCICYGYILGFMAVAFPEFKGPLFLALVLTISIVVALVVLYRARIVKVNSKFRSIISIIFFTMVLTSLLMLICYFIPATRGAVVWLANNAVLSIIGGILGVLIASMFLLSDFDSIENAVENRLDKKYENLLAFGLAFSVIWLYFKVLSLIMRIMDRKN